MDNGDLSWKCYHFQLCEFGINREAAYLLLCCFVKAKEHGITLMNKNISGVVVRGIVVIIVHLLSMRVE